MTFAPAPLHAVHGFGDRVLARPGDDAAVPVSQPTAFSTRQRCPHCRAESEQRCLQPPLWHLEMTSPLRRAHGRLYFADVDSA